MYKSARSTRTWVNLISAVIFGLDRWWMVANLVHRTTIRLSPGHFSEGAIIYFAEKPRVDRMDPTTRRGCRAKGHVQ